MFGISDENISQHSRRLEHPATEHEPLAVLTFNQTEVGLIRDGIDCIEVFQHPSKDEYYWVRYTGYIAGSAVITHNGLVELGTSYLSGEDEVPYWILEAEASIDERLEWIPEEYEFNQTVDCDSCSQELAIRDVCTIGPRGPDTSNYCRDCINKVMSQ